MYFCESHDSVPPSSGWRMCDVQSSEAVGLSVVEPQKEAGDCQITVVTLAGKVIMVVNVPLSETGDSLKSQVADTTGQHVNLQKLLYGDNEISNVVTMRELGLHDGSDETMVLLSGLAMCEVCGRKFRHDRVERHAEICKISGKHSKSNTTFSSAAQRVMEYEIQASQTAVPAGVQKENLENNGSDAVPAWKMKSCELRAAIAAKRRTALGSSEC